MVGGEGVWALGEQVGRWDGKEGRTELSSRLAVGIWGREGQDHSFEVAHSLVLPRDPCPLPRTAPLREPVHAAHTPPPRPFPPPRFTGRRVQRLSGSTRPFRPWFPQFSQPTPPGPHCLLPQLGFHGPSLASVPRVLLSSLTPLPLSAPHPHLGSWTWLERGAHLSGSGRPAWKPCTPLACCLSPLCAALHLFSSPPSS